MIYERIRWSSNMCNFLACRNIVCHIKKSSNILYNDLSGECCNVYLTTAASVEKTDNFLTLSMVECMLTDGKHDVTTTVPGQWRVWR
jgi:hypothetical protein